MAVDLMKILPEYFRPVIEFQQLMRINGEELEKLEEEKQEGVESFGMYQNLARAFQTRETRLEGTAEPEEEAEKG